MIVKEECECFCNGLRDLSNIDLIGLLNTFQKNGVYHHSMRMAIMKELQRRYDSEDRVRAP